MKNNIIFFDGKCNLCNSFVQLVLKRDLKNIFYFASLQSNIGFQMIQENNLENLDSIVYRRNKKIYVKSSAVLYVAKDLGSWYACLFAFIVVPQFFRNWVYNFIAKNRHQWFGTTSTCWVMQPKWSDKFVTQETN